MNEAIIGKVYHNRCVLLDAVHLAEAGIRKNDQVTLRIEGDAIVIRKAYPLDSSMSRQEVDDILAKLRV